ncbi:MAG: hypothetical protein KatS3mg044_0468 [Rhodothermaceae bacterium]|nr:MAG: hypothetical protein KatS3mg044_0468 [Rhodothermaceae bacterium]
MYRPALSCGALLLALSVLTACEDPSSVGLDLVGEQGGQPFVVAVPPAVIEQEVLSDVTGTIGTTGTILRTLAGQVEDPLLGRITTTGHIDFQAPSSVPENFRNGQVSSATLEMTIDYVYGDTTQPLVLTLHDIPEAWNASGTTADTLITARPEVVTEIRFAPTDSLVTVALPEAWVAAHDARLRATTFNDDFHGFQLAWRSGGAVVGFSPGGFRLRAVAGTDTVAFPAAKSVTRIEHTGGPDLGPDRILLQDGTGLNVRLRFDFTAETLRNHAVNRARLRLPTDTLTLQETPPGFVRPPLGEVVLYGITPDDTPVQITRVSRNADGQYVFETAGLLNVIQRMVLEEEIFDRFRLAVPTEQNTLNAALLLRDTTGTGGPAVLLTLTSPDN